MVVADENDNEPQFEFTQYKFQMSESEMAGYKIGQVRAFDLDKNDHVRYNIEGSDIVKKHVVIDRSSGPFYRIIEY